MLKKVLAALRLVPPKPNIAPARMLNPGYEDEPVRGEAEQES